MNGVKSVVICEVSPPSSRVSVETTLSLAVKPVSRAVEALQSPKPSGANIGATNPPSRASRLSSGDSTMFSRTSKFWSIHTMMDAANITVNAFCMKSFAFSQMS